MPKEHGDLERAQSPSGTTLDALSIFVPEDAPPQGLSFNHFVITGDEPLLFHCGKRKMFPLVSAAVARIMPLERLRWLAFGHFEADECGSMNEWLAAAPSAELMHGVVGCSVSINDMADQPPPGLSNCEIICNRGQSFSFLKTPQLAPRLDCQCSADTLKHLLSV